ncbi:MAG: alpha/beta hydrolase [Bdellovibrionota bacterium]
MKKMFLALCALMFSLSAFARTPDFDGMITLANGLKVYAIQYKAVGSAPTVVFLHGLTYDTTPWMPSANDLADKNYGVLIYDMRGMGKTLEANGEVKDIITLSQQVDDLAQVLDNRGIDKANLAGLSYGGGVGLAFAQKFPGRVDKLILMAPYVKALQQQDQYLTQQVKMFKMMHPTDKRSDDEIYDFEALKPFIFQNYPIYEPAVKKHPWRIGAVWEMVRGIRKFKATDIIHDLSNTHIHLIMAGKDQYVPAPDHMEFWNALGNESKLSRIVMAGSEHKMPEAIPHFLAGWLGLCLDGDNRLTNNVTFDGQPAAGTASAGSVSITGLPKN